VYSYPPLPLYAFTTTQQAAHHDPTIKLPLCDFSTSAGMVIISKIVWRYRDTSDARGGRDNCGCRPRRRAHWCRSHCASQLIFDDGRCRANVATLTRAMRSHFPGRRPRVSRFCRTTHAGRAIIFDNRTGALWPGSRTCISDQLSARANWFSSHARRRSARLAIGDFHATISRRVRTSPRLAPFRDMSKVGPALNRYDHTSGRCFVNQRLKFVSVAAAVWSYRTLLFRRGNTFERRLSSQVC
jgi:hypothetical protein